MKDNKKNYRDIRKKINSSWGDIDIANNKELKALDMRNKLDSNFYSQGEKWFNSGLPLEDAPEELRNNYSFVNGYERGRRLALIEEINKKNKSR